MQHKMERGARTVAPVETPTGYGIRPQGRMFIAVWYFTGKPADGYRELSKDGQTVAMHRTPADALRLIQQHKAKRAAKMQTTLF
jgi:hypothetical protein